jgi:hypothetical protein
MAIVAERSQRIQRTADVDGGDQRAEIMKHKVEVEFDEFGWRAIKRAARRQGVEVEELLVHAAMFYLANVDERRFSTRVFTPPEPGDPKPRKR